MTWVKIPRYKCNGSMFYSNSFHSRTAWTVHIWKIYNFVYKSIKREKACYPFDSEPMFFFLCFFFFVFVWMSVLFDFFRLFKNPCMIMCVLFFVSCCILGKFVDRCIFRTMVKFTKRSKCQWLMIHWYDQLYWLSS